MDINKTNNNDKKQSEYYGKIKFQEEEFVNIIHKAILTENGEKLILIGSYPPAIHIVDTIGFTSVVKRNGKCEYTDIFNLSDNTSLYGVQRLDRKIEIHGFCGLLETRKFKGTIKNSFCNYKTIDKGKSENVENIKNEKFRKFIVLVKEKEIVKLNVMNNENVELKLKENILESSFIKTGSNEIFLLILDVTLNLILIDISKFKVISEVKLKNDILAGKKESDNCDREINSYKIHLCKIEMKKRKINFAILNENLNFFYIKWIFGNESKNKVSVSGNLMIKNHYSYSDSSNNIAYLFELRELLEHSKFEHFFNKMQIFFDKINKLFIIVIYKYIIVFNMNTFETLKKIKHSEAITWLSRVEGRGTVIFGDSKSNMIYGFNLENMGLPLNWGDAIEK